MLGKKLKMCCRQTANGDLGRNGAFDTRVDLHGRPLRTRYALDGLNKVDAIIRERTSLLRGERECLQMQQRKAQSALLRRHLGLSKRG